jgi:hypothetical protein
MIPIPQRHLTKSNGLPEGHWISDDTVGYSSI